MIDPRFRHIFFVKICSIGPENISTAILPLQLLQAAQLSVNAKNKCTISIGNLPL